MPKILIENYRGFEIHFNTDEEIFTLFSDSRDNQNTKKSFASAKKYVDDYIKDNNDFKPVVVIQNPNRCSSIKKIKLTGIRKDGRFVYEEDGQKQQLSEYNEKDYVVYDPLIHDKILEELQKLNEVLKLASEAVVEKEKEFTGIPLKEIKSKYLV